MSLKMIGPEEIRAFLQRAWPTLLGVVGTIRADGSPHVVPVWYRYDGECVHIWTHEKRVWVQNIARDNRVAFSVQEAQPPFAAVTLRGRAEIVTSAGQDVSEEIHRITRRYIPEAEVEDYIREWLHLRTIVRIKPEKITAWREGY